MTIGEDIETLARTIWGEARGETYGGMLAVGHVIRNRATDPKGRWPATITAVCRQRKQFSCWNPIDPNHAKLLAVDVDNSAFRQALRAAVEVVSGSADMTQRANHYLRVDLAETAPPVWYDPSAITVDIGHHRFLRF